jgi:hypothetical protein
MKNIKLMIEVDVPTATNVDSLRHALSSAIEVYVAEELYGGATPDELTDIEDGELRVREVDVVHATAYVKDPRCFSVRPR